MTDEVYIAEYRKLANEYSGNQTSMGKFKGVDDALTSMGDYLVAIQTLKERYLKGKSSAALPVVP